MLRKSVLRPQRYEVNENFVVRVTLQRMADTELQRVEARLIDLSPGGAKLSVGRSLRFHEPVELMLHCDEMGLHLNATASVAWTRPTKDGDHCVGCIFDPPLVPESLEQLFAHGLLERRRTRRNSVRGQAVATWEPNTQETPVGLLDLSVGGFSILSPTPAKNGVGIHVALEREQGEPPLEIPALIRWQMQVDGGYVIGCAFKDQQTYSLLKNQLLPEEIDLPNLGSSKRTLAVLSAACLILAALTCWRWMTAGW